MKTKKHVYRVGDTVRVVTPEFFVRCGYPMDLTEEARRIQREHGKEIHELLRKIIGIPRDTARWDYAVVPTGYAKPSKLDYELAYLACRAKGFGGSKRQIYRRREEEHAGKEFYVVDKKIVVTGTRYSGVWGGYPGEEEYDPPGLADNKSHVILALNRAKYGFGDPWDNCLAIEAAHVEPVTSDKI